MGKRYNVKKILEDLMPGMHEKADQAFHLRL